MARLQTYSDGLQKAHEGENTFGKEPSPKKKRQRGSDESGSGDSDWSSDDSGDSHENMMKKFISIEKFNQYKSEVLMVMSQQTSFLQLMKRSNEEFMEYQTSIMSKINKIDWDMVIRAEHFKVMALQDFKIVIDQFQNDMGADLKRYKIEHVSLENKYEALTLWIKSMSKVNQRMKDFLFKQADETRWQVQAVSECLKMQAVKDIQDDRDRKKIGLMGLQSEAAAGVASPRPGLLTPDPLLSPDSACLNCKSTSQKDKSAIIKSFRMACLHYQASKVQMASGETMQRADVSRLQNDKIDFLDQVMLDQQKG